MVNIHDDITECVFKFNVHLNRQKREMLSRKSKDKTIKEGVVGKYVKKETPPEIPSKQVRVSHGAFQLTPFLILSL